MIGLKLEDEVMNNQRFSSFDRFLSFFLKLLKFSCMILLIGALVGCQAINNSGNETLTPTPTPPARADLQVPGLVQLVKGIHIFPVLPENPSQGDYGASPYYQICLACHGDWGQGLTDEWRAQWGADSNCWVSKCHAANHPPEGFDLPKTIPPILGLGSLARFNTAEELHGHIATSMPWWNPGSLTEEQAWNLTAYLLENRGELTRGVTIDDGNTPIIRMHIPATPVLDYQPGAIALIASLTIVAIAFILRKDKPQ
jgi:mono/diheme cytochrome c family protein